MIGHIIAITLLTAATPAIADWPTHRGNNARTGCLDDKPGPAKPQVLWLHKSPEHYVASPVVAGPGLLVSGLGAFNTGVFYRLSLDPAAGSDRITWTKSPPFIKRPIVCPPAVTDGLLAFGDGMHQTDGAILYCLSARTGRPIWQFDVTGKLVHLEGSPTIDGDRVYVGGGGGGVLCIELKKATLDGKVQDAAAIEKRLDEIWAQLMKRYEEERVRDDLAMPPTDDALPRAAAVVRWRKGQDAWHVDAPVAVRNGRVYAASAFLDEEKVGRRTLLCLNAADGNLAWEAELQVNPWAGPTLAGDLVLVGCSSIRFDRKLLKDARGQVVAYDANSGTFKWRIDVPGGVLSSIAVKGDTAIFTATDGKVRAVNLADGKQRWAYEAAGGFFAGPAVAGDAVYAADLGGVLHAIRLADGKGIWAINVTMDPSLMSPGSVFGSPIVHDGRVYLATCNIDSEAVNPVCAVVCVADSSLAVAASKAAEIIVDRQKRQVRLAAQIAPRKLVTLKDIYPLEVIASFPSPRGQKAHETVITFEATPSEVHKAIEQIGLKAGSPGLGEERAPAGPRVRLTLEFPGPTGVLRQVPIERTIIDKRTGRAMPSLTWHFTGSAMRQPDPNRDLKAYGADLTGTLVAIFPVTDETVFQSNLTMRDSQLLRLETNRNILPAEGTDVTLVIQAE